MEFDIFERLMNEYGAKVNIMFDKEQINMFYKYILLSFLLILHRRCFVLGNQNVNLRDNSIKQVSND